MFSTHAGYKLGLNNIILCNSLQGDQIVPKSTYKVTNIICDFNDNLKLFKYDAIWSLNVIFCLEHLF